MSLLRERAIAVSFESTLRALRPAAARAWFVRLTSFDSDVELKLFTSQANVVRGAASSPTDVRMNAIATIATTRRGSPRTVAGRLRAGPGAAARTVIGGSGFRRGGGGGTGGFGPSRAQRGKTRRAG